MGDAGLLRLLAVARRELDADDARLEIGGAPPDDERLLWCPVGAHRRLVVVFAAPPADRAAKQDKLEHLAETFHDIADSVIPPAPEPTGTARAALDAELEGVCARSQARAVLIVDRSSPVVWGRSHPALPEQIEALLERRDDDDAVLRVAARAVAEARALTEGQPPGPFRKSLQGDGFALLVRSIAGAYLLVLAFDGPFSEIRADGVAKRALGRLERLVAALPPIEPPPKGKRSLSLHKP